MKTPILISIFVSLLNTAVFAQGTINVGNGIAATRFPIYGWPVQFGLTPVVGNGPLSAPTGTAIYTGALLSGTRYAIEFWAGPASAVDFSGLSLITTMTFRTAATPTALPNGITPTINQMAIPGVPAGAQAKLAVRVWDTWSSAFYANAYPRGQGQLFLSSGLGGLAPDGLYTPANWIGQSFEFPYTPEPSVLALTGISAAAFYFRRRK